MSVALTARMMDDLKPTCMVSCNGCYRIGQPLLTALGKSVQVDILINKATIDFSGNDNAPWFFSPCTNVLL